MKASILLMGLASIALTGCSFPYSRVPLCIHAAKRKIRMLPVS
jgi:hypothetical protein